MTISFVNSTFLLISLHNGTSNQTEILTSNDLGHNWTKIHTFTSLIYPYQLYTTYNQTIFLLATDPSNINKLTIFNSIDFGKTWEEKYSNLPYYRQEVSLSMDSNFNLFYFYSEEKRIKILKSTDFGVSWNPEIFPELEKDLPHTPRDVMMDISSDDEIFIGYSIECPRIFPLNPCDILNYFFIGKDIWSVRYISWFFGYFLIFTAVLSAIEIIIYILLIKWKKGKTI